MSPFTFAFPAPSCTLSQLEASSFCFSTITSFPYFFRFFRCTSFHLHSSRLLILTPPLLIYLLILVHRSFTHLLLSSSLAPLPFALLFCFFFRSRSLFIFFLPFSLVPPFYFRFGFNHSVVFIVSSRSPLYTDLRSTPKHLFSSHEFGFLALFFFRPNPGVGSS